MKSKLWEINAKYFLVKDQETVQIQEIGELIDAKLLILSTLNLLQHKIKSVNILLEVFLVYYWTEWNGFDERNETSERNRKKQTLFQRDLKERIALDCPIVTSDKAAELVFAQKTSDQRCSLSHHHQHLPSIWTRLSNSTVVYCYFLRISLEIFFRQNIYN